MSQRKQRLSEEDFDKAVQERMKEVEIPHHVSVESWNRPLDELYVEAQCSCGWAKGIRRHVSHREELVRWGQAVKELHEEGL